MKKVAKLNERDLSRIVRRVINEDKEEEMDKKESTIDYVDVYDQVIEALQDSGEYNESMDYPAEELAWDIFNRMKDDLYYISENYEDDINDIIEQFGDSYGDED